jgi:hypothetical protein
VDRRTQELFRRLKATPGDDELRERVRASLARSFSSPDAVFQHDLRPEGRLNMALRDWMEFSRISVRCKKGGGLLTCHVRSTLARPTHVRIWYPTLDDVMDGLYLEDVRIIVASTWAFSDTVEALEEYFPGATIVSSAVANVQPDMDASHDWDGWRKPKRSDRVDRRVLAEQEAATGSTRGRGWGDNSWLG